MNNKKCIKCNKIFDESSFHQSKHHKSGKTNCCKNCSNNRNKNYKLNNKNENLKSQVAILNKKCCRCKQIKTIEFFYKNILEKNGFSKMCKNCEIIRDAKRNKTKAERNQNTPFNELELKKCSICLEIKEKKFYSRNYYKASLVASACLNCSRNRDLIKKYGITLNDKKLKYEFQNNKCDICKNYTEFDKIVVDHNHTTGQIRSLLCGTCNLTLGRIENNLKIIDYMKEYLIKWQGKVDIKPESITPINV